MRKFSFVLAACAMSLAIGLAPQVKAADASAEATYQDIEKTLGMVPSFFKLFPESGVAGAWMEFKTIQLNPETKLNGKTKELIGVAIAAQIPCEYCVYFHTSAAKANGASEEEIREAVAMAAIVRHWSTVLNGMQVDINGFKKEVDTVMAGAAKSKSASTTSE